MSSLFGIFNIAKRGMSAQQTALNVVSHNISNANTDGYSVQRANFETTDPSGVPSVTNVGGPGQLGTGVQISSITRARDSFLDAQVRNESASLATYNTAENYLSQVETVLNEPSDTGLSEVMGQFWDSWQQLANNPESSAARTLVAQNADTLASTINHDYSQLDGLQSNASQEEQQSISDAGSILNQIAALNSQIKSVVISGEQPNDLLDRRDQLLDQLSKDFSFNVTNNAYDGITISAKLANGASPQVLLQDSTVNQSLAYVDNINYSIDYSGSAGNINVLGLNGSNNPTAISYDNVTIGLNNDHSDSITDPLNSINVNGVTLKDLQTADFGDGTEIKQTAPNTFTIGIGATSKTVQVFKDTDGNIKATVDGATPPVAGDSSSVTVGDVKFTWDSTNVSTIAYNGSTLNYDGSKIGVAAGNKTVQYDSGSGSITVLDGTNTDTITRSGTLSQSVKAEAVLYMNGNVNNTLEIKNIGIGSSLYNQLSSSKAVLYNPAYYNSSITSLDYSVSAQQTQIDNDLGLQSASFDSGSIVGDESANQEIDGYKTQLNNLARSLAISVNTIHSNEGQSMNFFDDSAETDSEPAKVLSVSQSILNDVSNINAGQQIGGNPGNGDRALLIGQLSNTRMDILNIKSRADFVNDVGFTPSDPSNNTVLTMTSSNTGTTLGGYYNNTVSDLGTTSQSAQRNVTNQTSLVNQLTTRRQSISGVSIDEEMTNMIQFQRSYEANAKIISTIDELLDVVVNGLTSKM